jgi:hypothetical protein
VVGCAAAPPTFNPSLVETAAVLTAAIAILQTEVTFERSRDGKWKAKIHHQAASDALLRALAHAIVRAIPGLGTGAGDGAKHLPQ